MLDHVTLGVSDLERSKRFYDQALRPLGIERLYADGQTGIGYGIAPKAFFWISLRHAATTGAQTFAHVAFTAQDREAVKQFHMKALEAGGKDNGAPGLRLHYHENYFGAFILDPDGHNIEAVCHRKQT